MNAFGILAVANSKEAELSYIWRQATPEGKAVIVCLVIFSIIAWTVMIGKAIQMRRAKKLNRFFDSEFHTQKNVLDVFDRRVQAEGCPLFMVYQAGSVELDTRLKNPDGNGRKQSDDCNHNHYLNQRKPERRARRSAILQNRSHLLMELLINFRI